MKLKNCALTREQNTMNKSDFCELSSDICIAIRKIVMGRRKSIYSLMEKIAIVKEASAKETL